MTTEPERIPALLRNRREISIDLPGMVSTPGHTRDQQGRFQALAEHSTTGIHTPELELGQRVVYEVNAVEKGALLPEPHLTASCELQVVRFAAFQVFAVLIWRPWWDPFLVPGGILASAKLALLDKSGERQPLTCGSVRNLVKLAFHMVATNTTANNPFLLLLGQLKPLLDARLDTLLEAERASQGPLGPEVDAMLRAAQDLSRGGKRLRAGLLCCGLPPISAELERVREGPRTCHYRCCKAVWHWSCSRATS